MRKVVCPVASRSTLERWQAGAELLGHSGVFKTATRSCGNARSAPKSALSHCRGGGNCDSTAVQWQQENYTRSTCSTLPYPISVKCRIIPIQRAGTCFSSINRVVLQSIPRGSRELSPFYKLGNSGTGIKAKMFQPGCLLLGTYTHIYATRGLIFRRAGQWKFWPEGFVHTQCAANNTQDGSLVCATCLTP